MKKKKKKKLGIFVTIFQQSNTHSNRCLQSKVLKNLNQFSTWALVLPRKQYFYQADKSSEIRY